MILIVDDEGVILEILHNMIESIDSKLEVLTALDGIDGLKKYKENQNNIKFILTDIKMPHKSGLDLLSEINDLGSPPISCIMSGHLPKLDDFEYSNQLFAISKPFAHKDVADILSKFR